MIELNELYSAATLEHHVLGSGANLSQCDRHRTDPSFKPSIAIKYMCSE